MKNENECSKVAQKIVDLTGYGQALHVNDILPDLKELVTTAVAKDRQRILGLPCMKEEGREFVPWASCESDEAYAAGKKDGANFLRRELKEEINI